MKVAVQCESPLLQRSLELFLEPYLATHRQCDVVVRDRRSLDEAKPQLIVSNDDGDLAKPFSRSQLMLALEQIVDTKKQAREAIAISDELDDLFENVENEVKASGVEAPDLAALEKRLEALTREYQKSVMQAVRSFYEK
jgi:hypothetical protein